MCVAENLKNREREVGQQVGEMAEETCQKSLQEEIRLYYIINFFYHKNVYFHVVYSELEF